MPHPHVAPGYTAQIEAILSRYDVRPSRKASVKHQNTMISFASTGRGMALLPESIAHGLTSVAVLSLSEEDAEVVSWLVYREEDASDGLSFALELASAIDSGGPLPSRGAPAD